MNIAEIRLLSLVEVVQQAPDGQKQGGIGGGELVLGLLPELAHHGALRVLLAEVGGRALLHAAVEPVLEQGRQVLILEGAVVHHRLHRGEPAQLVFHMLQAVLARKAGGVGLAGGDVAEAEAGAAAVQKDAADVIPPPLLQSRGIGDRARGHHPDDVPPDHALGGSRVLHLLADGHLVPLGDEPGPHRRRWNGRARRT